uniref:Uncharacterized protein n=1 Tax=Moniliophthora roreri TaxID=221103 RepID=A0A0W0FY33_MONRR
MSYDIRTRNQT